MTLVLALGFAVGMVMGLTGAGGGILAVPVLVFGIDLTVAQAGPVGLMAVGMGAAIGALIGLKARLVRYRAALLIAASGMAMAPLGLWLARRLDTRLITVIFAAVLMWVAYKTLRESAAQAGVSPPGAAWQPCMRNPGSGRFVWTTRCARALAAAGGVAGALSGLLGVGGGFVMVPALQRFTDLDPKSVVATSLAVIALISLTGVGASLAAGALDLAVALPFSLGTAAGMVAATLLAARLPPRFLKLAFAFICIAVAGGLIVKSW